MLGDIVDVLWLSRYDYKPGWSLYPHEHPYFQLIYIMSGEGAFRYGEQELPIRAGGSFLIRPDQNHSLANTSQTTLKTLDIKFHIYDQDLRARIDEMDSMLFIESTETELYWNRIKEESQNKLPFYKESGRLQLTLMLYHLIRVGDPACNIEEQEPLPGIVAEDNGIMQKFMEFIQLNYHQDLSLDSISEAICYNKSYLCQMFRKCYDSTPMRFLYDLRVQKAKELIRTSDYDLKQVAAMTGFNSIHHFCRTFTNSVGMSPGSYRDVERSSIYRDICVDESFKNIIYVSGLMGNQEDGAVQIG